MLGYYQKLSVLYSWNVDRIANSIDLVYSTKIQTPEKKLGNRFKHFAMKRFQDTYNRIEEGVQVPLNDETVDDSNLGLRVLAWSQSQGINRTAPNNWTAVNKVVRDWGLQYRQGKENVHQIAGQLIAHFGDFDPDTMLIVLRELRRRYDFPVKEMQTLITQYNDFYDNFLQRNKTEPSSDTR